MKADQDGVPGRVLPSKAEVRVRIQPLHAVGGGVVQRQHRIVIDTGRQVQLLAASTFIQAGIGLLFPLCLKTNFRG